jgi:hypothetical protein
MEEVALVSRHHADADISDVGTVGTLSGTASANGLGEPTTREIDLWLKLIF